jgi:hypothetical protein
MLHSNDASTAEHATIATVSTQPKDGEPPRDTTCLRPLGLCELGGCCDTCWYRPDHPRFQSREE